MCVRSHANAYSYVGDKFVGQVAHGASPYSIHAIALDTSVANICVYRVLLRHGTERGKSLVAVMLDLI